MKPDLGKGSTSPKIKFSGKPRNEKFLSKNFDFEFSLDFGRKTPEVSYFMHEISMQRKFSHGMNNLGKAGT